MRVDSRAWGTQQALCLGSLPWGWAGAAHLEQPLGLPPASNGCSVGWKLFPNLQTARLISASSFEAALLRAHMLVPKRLDSAAPWALPSFGWALPSPQQQQRGIHPAGTATTSPKIRPGRLCVMAFSRTLFLAHPSYQERKEALST